MGTKAPLDLPIIRSRGDTKSFSYLWQDKRKKPIDITGRTYLFTVNLLKDPPDITSQVFQIAGVVDGPNGRVTFTPTLADADQLAKEYYFDVQQTEGTAIDTPIKSTWTVEQDITK